jgi:hypothetical protein
MDKMSRIVLTDGTGRFFFTSKAQKFEEDTRWDGNNHVSLATGSEFDHEALYRTKKGLWVLHSWSQWQGSSDSWEEIDDADAARWLSLNNHKPIDACKAEYSRLNMDADLPASA